VAGNTPFRRYKQVVELGGVRSPLVVSWPRSLRGTNKVRNQFLHAIDVAPTLMQLARAPRAADFDGESFAATFDDAAASAPRRTQYWEMFGRRAVYADGWKAVSSHEKGDDYDYDDWRLHDLGRDFSECHDLASRYPETLQRLQDIWWREAEANDVLPLDDRTLVDIISFRQPNGVMAADTVTLYPGGSHVPQTTMITSSERSMRMTAHFRASRGEAEGVLVSAGDPLGGYTLYIKDGTLSFEHVRMGKRTTVSAPVPATTRRCGLQLDVNEDATARVGLFTDGITVARAPIPQVAVHLSFWGLDAGRDAGLPVSKAYDGDFPFPDDVLDRVTLNFPGQADSPRRALRVELTE